MDNVVKFVCASILAQTESEHWPKTRENNIFKSVKLLMVFTIQLMNGDIVIYQVNKALNMYRQDKKLFPECICQVTGRACNRYEQDYREETKKTA